MDRYAQLMVETPELHNQLTNSQSQGSPWPKSWRIPSGKKSPQPGSPCSSPQKSTPVKPVTICNGTRGVDEATARLETQPIEQCLPRRITEIVMNPAILKLHAIRKVGKQRQLHLRFRGVSSAGKESIFEILVDTGAQLSAVRKGLLSSRPLRRSAAPVTLRVTNGEIMEGGLDEAAISLEQILVTNPRSRGCSTKQTCRRGT